MFLLLPGVRADCNHVRKSSDFETWIDDDWNIQSLIPAKVFRYELEGQSNDTAGCEGAALNINALNEMSVWVTGNYFSSAIGPYFKASFMKVKHVAHWQCELKSSRNKIESYV